MGIIVGSKSAVTSGSNTSNNTFIESGSIYMGAANITYTGNTTFYSAFRSGSKEIRVSEYTQIPFIIDDQDGDLEVISYAYLEGSPLNSFSLDADGVLLTAIDSNYAEASVISGSLEIWAKIASTSADSGRLSVQI